VSEELNGLMLQPYEPLVKGRLGMIAAMKPKMAAIAKM